MINRLKISLILLLGISLFFVIYPVHASNKSWTAKKNQSDILIYQRPTKSGYPETRGTLKIYSSLENLLAVMSDRSNCNQWVFACRFGKIIKKISSEERIDYTVVDSPLWFADRDMYIHAKSEFIPATKMFYIQLSGRANHDKIHAGRVRVTELYGNWTIKEISKQELSVNYTIHTNPQLVPSHLFDLYMVESVYTTLAGLKRLTENQ